MSLDMTYQEINDTKVYIRDFLNEIQNIAGKNNFVLLQFDKDFFTIIAKHIIFIKYVLEDNALKNHYKSLISDFYYLILGFLNNEIRYVYLNERSIIENYLRIIMNDSIQNGHVTLKIIEKLCLQQFRCNFTGSEYSLIKSEYSTSCGYIHGGSILNNNLAYVLEQCLFNNSYKNATDRNKHYIRLTMILKTFDRLLISEKCEYISGCFHRKKTLMSYLVGREAVDLLFKIVNSNNPI